MKIYLAGTGALKKYPDELRRIPFILESFYSVSDWQIPFLKGCRSFLLDSGAFSFLEKQRKTGAVNSFKEIASYTDRYIDFIKENDVDLFFEMDIDPIIGYDGVVKLRERIERKVGKQTVPVWHISRGKEEFINLCKEYSYISIGGVRYEITKSRWKYFPWFIETAHKYSCEVHGLGFTASSEFDRIRFDTVDSTTWLNSGRFANISHYHDGKIVQEHKYGYRLVEKDKLLLHNLHEWLKCVKYWEEKV